MTKFMKLVKNEYIKNFKKVSTWVIFILVFLMIIGFVSIQKVTQSFVNDSWYHDMSQEEIKNMYSYDINYYETEKPENWEVEVERYTYFIDNAIDYTDWRFSTANLIFDNKGNLAQNLSDGFITQQEYDEAIKNIDETLTAMANNDYKSVFQSEIDNINSNEFLSKEEKEAQTFYYEYMIENDINPEDDTWEGNYALEIGYTMSAIASIESSTGQISSEEMAQLAQMKEELLLAQHRLENNIEHLPGENIEDSMGEISFWTTLQESTMLMTLLSLAIIIIAGGIIANEFSTGTIKFLLINPVKRYKIFLSKYFMIISLSFILILIFYILTVVLSGILFGFGDISNPYLYVQDGAVHEVSGLLYVFWTYLLSGVNLIVMGTLAFAISSLFRNSALAIGLSVFLMLAGNVLVMFLKVALQLDWSRFLIFANLDLNAVANSQTLFTDMTMGFSLSVIAVHMVIFFLTAWDGFMRRDSI